MKSIQLAFEFRLSHGDMEALKQKLDAGTRFATLAPSISASLHITLGFESTQELAAFLHVPASRITPPDALHYKSSIEANLEKIARELSQLRDENQQVVTSGPMVADPVLDKAIKEYLLCQFKPILH